MCESTNHEQKYLQFVVLKIHRKQALEACHDDIGHWHCGIERTESLLKDQFYWPNMGKDIEMYVKSLSSLS